MYDGTRHEDSLFQGQWVPRKKQHASCPLARNRPKRTYSPSQLSSKNITVWSFPQEMTHLYEGIINSISWDNSIFYTIVLLFVVDLSVCRVKPMFLQLKTMRWWSSCMELSRKHNNRTVNYSCFLHLSIVQFEKQHLCMHTTTNWNGWCLRSTFFHYTISVWLFVMPSLVFQINMQNLIYLGS